MKLEHTLTEELKLVFWREVE